MYIPHPDITHRASIFHARKLHNAEYMHKNTAQTHTHTHTHSQICIHDATQYNL